MAELLWQTADSSRWVPFWQIQECACKLQASIGHPGWNLQTWRWILQGPCFLCAFLRASL